MNSNRKEWRNITTIVVSIFFLILTPDKRGILGKNDVLKISLAQLYNGGISRFWFVFSDRGVTRRIGCTKCLTHYQLFAIGQWIFNNQCYRGLSQGNNFL